MMLVDTESLRNTGSLKGGMACDVKRWLSYTTQSRGRDAIYQHFRA
jgi:hypothetical protein